MQKDAHLSINGGAGKEPRPFAFKALPFGIKKVTNVGETISYKRDSTGRILPQSSRPTRPTEPETVHSGGDKGKGKASHPTVKHLTADFASMSFNVIENERDQMDNFRNIASMPIVFGAPEEGT